MCVLNAQSSEVELTTTCHLSAQLTSYRSLISKLNAKELPKELEDIAKDIRQELYTGTVPYTTRAPREGERDGVHYYFVTKEEFQRLEKEGKFLEVGESNGVFYGTSVTIHENKASSIGRPSNIRRRLSSRTQSSNRQRYFVISANGREVRYSGFAFK